MRVPNLTLPLFLSLFFISCQETSKTTTDNTVKSEVITIDTPDWKSNKVITEFSETIATKPFRQDLTLKVIGVENSIETGEFVLEIHWAEQVHHHDIQLPVIPGKFYGEPFISKDTDRLHTYDIGYINEENEEKGLYEVAIKNSNLHFKKVQDFYIAPES